MPWPNIFGKLSPTRILPILREGQCSPVSNYKYVMIILRELAVSKVSLWPLDFSCSKTPTMPSDHHDSPPDQFEADHPDERSSIGDSSLLAPPTSFHRSTFNYSSPPTDPHEPHSFLDELVTSLDPPIALATAMNLGSAAAS